jgi:hypothetical protein
MKSKAELKAELEKLQADMALIMDRPASSPEVKAWIDKTLQIKSMLSKNMH